jgi:hypothetical protein
MGLAMPIEDD